MFCISYIPGIPGYLIEITGINIAGPGYNDGILEFKAFNITVFRLVASQPGMILIAAEINFQLSLLGFKHLRPMLTLNL